MNSVQKGNRNERKCEVELQSQGWLTERPRRTRFNKIDFFGLFDVMAIHPLMGVLLVQVKSNRCPKPVREAISAFKVPTGVFKQIWIWVDRSGWKILSVGNQTP